jgi:hypothetical protein
MKIRSLWTIPCVLFEQFPNMGKGFPLSTLFSVAQNSEKLIFDIRRMHTTLIRNKKRNHHME